MQNKGVSTSDSSETKQQLPETQNAPNSQHKEEVTTAEKFSSNPTTESPDTPLKERSPSTYLWLLLLLLLSLVGGGLLFSRKRK